MSWLAALASHPIVTRLWPAIVELLSRWLKPGQDDRALPAAVDQAKSAESAEELRDASEKLARAVNPGE